MAAQVFVSGLWQGCALVAAVVICLRLLPGVNASLRFAIWMLTFTLIAALPFLPFGVQSSGQAAHTSMVHAGKQWAVAIGLVWAVLMAARATQLFMQGVQLHRVWRRADPVVVGAELLALLESGSRPAVLCVSSDVDSPGVIGFLRPRLLIPRALYPALKPEELRQILLHECAHLQRNDDWINLLQKVALVLFPLNLALIWIDRRLGSERELACDARVVASTEAPLQYARCLTELAEHRLACRRLALLLPAWSRHAELSRRVHNLLQPRRAMSSRWASASGILVCLCVAGTAVELGRVPRLVSFESGLVDVNSAQSLGEAPVPKLGFSVVSTGGERRIASAGPKPVRAQLVSVSMPSQRSVAEGLAERPMVSLPRQVRASLHGMPPASSRVVLTRQRSATSAQRVYDERRLMALPAVLTKISTSYAAVPFGDGWLIVQL